MSLFLGIDDNNNKILHLTAGQTDISLMKSGILSTTVFHSSLTYLTFDTIDIQAVYNSRSYTHIEIDRNKAATLGSSNIGYFFIIRGNIYTAGSYLSRTSIWDSGRIAGILYQTSYGAWSDVYPNYGWSFSFTPSYTYNKFSIPGTYSLSDIVLVTINIEDNTYIPINLDSSGIQISKNYFLVGGKDLLNFKYINSQVINSIDPTGAFGSRIIQLVNASPSGTDLSIYSSSLSGLSEIRQGGKALFSNAYGALGMNYGGSASLTFPSYFASAHHTREFYRYASVSLASLNITDSSSFGIAFIETNYSPADASKPVAARTLIAGPCGWTQFSYDFDERKTPGGTLLVWYNVIVSYRVTDTAIEFRQYIRSYGNVDFTFSATYVNVVAFGI
jgi:hypothetical protein